jgi:chaperone required for assembly of F1-ATPase
MSEAPTLPRRFYKQVIVAEGEGDAHVVKLDDRTLRTPGGLVFVAPTKALAQLCAEEWAAQGEHIVPASMPITQLAFAALDSTAKRREELCSYVASFGATDLCCHRAEAPADLVERQALAWDSLVDWGRTALGVSLPVVTGVIAASVGGETLARLRAHAAALDDFRLTALAQTAGLAGSVLIAFALLRRSIGPEEAFAAAALDNLWSLERWGEDEEARTRLDRQRAEFMALGRFIEALEA